MLPLAFLSLFVATLLWARALSRYWRTRSTSRWVIRGSLVLLLYLPIMGMLFFPSQGIPTGDQAARMAESRAQAMLGAYGVCVAQFALLVVTILLWRRERSGKPQT